MVVHLLRFFAPLLAFFGREGVVGGAFVRVEVREGELEGLAGGFLGGGRVFWVLSAAGEGCGVEGLVGACEEDGFSSSRYLRCIAKSCKAQAIGGGSH